MTAYTPEIRDIAGAVYRWNKKYTRVCAAACATACLRHTRILYARIIIPRVWGFIKNRMYCKSSGRLQNRVRPFTTNIVSEESAREPSEEFFFRP